WVSENRTTLLSTNPAAGPAAMMSTSRRSFRPLGKTAQIAPDREIHDSNRVSCPTASGRSTSTKIRSLCRRRRRDRSAPRRSSSARKSRSRMPITETRDPGFTPSLSARGFVDAVGCDTGPSGGLVGVSRLHPPGLRPGSDDGSKRREGHDRHDLAAEDDPIHVHRRPPAHRAVPDDVHTGRPRVQTESGPEALALVGALATASSGAAHELGHRDDLDAVLLVRLAEHSLHAQRVAALPRHVLDVHAPTSLSWASPGR